MGEWSPARRPDRRVEREKYLERLNQEEISDANIASPGSEPPSDSPRRIDSNSSPDPQPAGAMSKAVPPIKRLPPRNGSNKPSALDFRGRLREKESRILFLSDLPLVGETQRDSSEDEGGVPGPISSSTVTNKNNSSGPSLTEQILRTLLSQFGKVLSLRLVGRGLCVADQWGKKSASYQAYNEHPFGFTEFETHASARLAQRCLNGFALGGAALKCVFLREALREDGKSVEDAMGGVALGTQGGLQESQLANRELILLKAMAPKSGLIGLSGRRVLSSEGEGSPTRKDARPTNLVSVLRPLHAANPLSTIIDSISHDLNLDSGSVESEAAVLNLAQTLLSGEITNASGQALDMLSLLDPINSGAPANKTIVTSDGTLLSMPAPQQYFPGTTISIVRPDNLYQSALYTQTAAAKRPKALSVMTRLNLNHGDTAARIRQSVEVGQQPSKVVQLLNVVYEVDLLHDEEFEEIQQSIAGEAKTYGKIAEITIPRPSENARKRLVEGLNLLNSTITTASAALAEKRSLQEQQQGAEQGVGKVFLLFDDLRGARVAQSRMNGKSFDGRVVCAAFYPMDRYSKGEYVL